MFLTPCLRRIFTEPANHNKPRQTKPPAGSSRGASGGGLYYINFSARFTLRGLPGAVHTARFTLQGFAASGGGYSDSPSMPSRANAVKRDTARKYFFW